MPGLLTRAVNLADQLDDRLRKMETVRVTHMEWLVGDIRREFGNLMRGFRSRGGRMDVDRNREP